MSSLGAILATDVGSTTTKAILIERRGDEYRLAGRGEAPTTVEAPHEDVMVGVFDSLRRLEEATGRRVVDGQRILVPANGQDGVDLFVATSSAGGGLQMTVAGLIKSLTAESAQRAALGAGAIVMDVISIDDARLVIERIRRLKELRPDMILLSGGTDEGSISHVAAIAEYIAAANPRPRLGGGYKVPVIYAGNVKAREYVEDVLGELTDVRVIDNIRPKLETENLEPARRAIHELFLEHVMAMAPGYPKLLELTDSRIEPTPMAVGKILQLLAERQQLNVVAVDIGGATTDVFSIMEGKFNRTVNANLGMSYSLANVFVEAGVANIIRWLPFDLSERELRNWTANKMIRPTTLPQELDELILEHALAREAVRLSFEHHRSLAVTLRGVQQKRTFDEVFTQRGTGQPLVDLSKMDVIVGSGGVLSNAPRRAQAMLMMIDAIQPESVSRLFVDSIFMMPHLGVLSDSEPDIALQVFLKDCLVPLGTCIALKAPAKLDELLGVVTLSLPDGRTQQVEVRGGKLLRLPLGTAERAGVVIEPKRHVDAGAGPGRRVSGEVSGGEIGLVIDGRGRPIWIPEQPAARIRMLRQWYEQLGLYDADMLGRYEVAHQGGAGR
ncbi:MAG: glutamate mutase L [Bacillota bacterium]|nr:glutamate mutase L [Bacillota bacterium]